MRHRIWFVAVGALCLAACGSTSAPPPGVPSGSPVAVTPLGDTTVDETTIIGLWHGADLLAASVEFGLATGTITKGSPFALRMRGLLIDVKKWLNVADEAQRAGNAASYQLAFDHAQRAYRLAKGELKPGSG